MKDLLNIISKFRVQGTVSETKPLGIGLINDTYKISTTEADAPDYALRRVNHAIFQNVGILQDSTAAVTGHTHKKLTETEETDIDHKVLAFLPTKEGKTYWFDGDNYWRVMVFIPRVKTYEAINPEYSYYVGAAFGNFQAMLTDISITLDETIPDFHNMEFHLKQLREAIAASTAGRVTEVQYYLGEMEKRADEMCKTERLHREGKLPKRVCHCDTKVNNMMFDEDGGVLCVVDLDTVAPSLIFSGYGDFLRTGVNTRDKDDKNLDDINFNMEIFRAFTKEYLEGADSFLTPIEIENLSYTATLFPYMQCVRFLADYISGDTYYKIKYPEHNLVHTRAQFELLQSVEEHTPEMEAYTKECLG